MSGGEIRSECRALAERARAAQRRLALLTGAERDGILRDTAASLRARESDILRANERDLRAGADLDEAMRDRLRLDADRVKAIARAVDEIAAQPDPVGRVVDGRRLANGLRLEKRRVPLGVVLMIYESRPNVTADASALCLKAGNAVVLRGGKEAAHSNGAIVEAVRAPLDARGLADAVGFVATPDRAAIPELLALEGLIDLCVPRGGPGLMRAVTDVARIPVVKHDAGVCHIYLDEHLDGLEETATRIVVNAKVQRPGVCNAVETLLVHAAHAGAPLTRLGAALRAEGVELRCDERALRAIDGAVPASDDDWGAEFLAKVLAVRVVDSLEDACAHIERHGSGHTDAIITSSVRAAQAFVARTDSANVMVNCSTRFADGGQYGLGAEIGISTEKLHARGPMGAEDLTTFQWVVEGDGQVRA